MWMKLGSSHRCLPNRTLTFKGEHCHGGKLSKEQLTLLLSANMDGSDKIDPLVIGKSCWEHSTAWMIGVIWQQWIKSFNRRMNQQNKKVLLLVDNCSGHPMMTGLSNVTIQYLPLQTTFHLHLLPKQLSMMCFKFEEALSVQRLKDLLALETSTIWLKKQTKLSDFFSTQ